MICVVTWVSNPVIGNMFGVKVKVFMEDKKKEVAET